MAVNRGIAVRQNGAVGVTPLEHRLSVAGMLTHNAPGVPRAGLLDPPAVVVTGAGSWNYNFGPCNPVIVRAAWDGAYLPTLTGSTSVPCSAAPGTGFRYDLIWVKQNDIDKGDPDNLAYVGVTEGGASSSPAKPYASVPTGAMVIAEALVGSGATGTNHANVTITQVFSYTTTRGSILRVRDAADRSTITDPTEGFQVRRLDIESTVETWKFGAWQPVTANGTAGTLQTGWTTVSTLKLWTPDNVTAHLVGAVKFNAGAGGDILQLPSGWNPGQGGIVYPGGCLASNGPTNKVGGPAVEYLLENGMIKIGYQSASIPVGSILALHLTWLMV